MHATSDADAAARLQQQLAARELPCAVHWLADIDSTNAEALRRVRAAPASAPQCLVAGAQSAGRGRQGRSWVDADDSAMLSLAWPFAPGCAVGALSLAVGVWLAQALQALGADAVRLKWPNDVLLRGAKLAGVLVELADTPAARWAVIGIGVNLRRPPGVDGAAALADVLPQATRWSVLDALLPVLLQALPGYAQAGFAPWQPTWNALHAWTGAAVRLLEGGRLRTGGVARGVDTDGCLLLDTGHGVERVHSGDVSLRRAHD
jgi:BirA family biotin operon repressor/biotin-[acetyl-CoA-carboxylase] ligase